MAQDKGYPPLSRTVEVQIDVVDRANNPPVWDHVAYGPIYCKENTAVGAKVVSVKARSVTLLMLRAAARTRPARKNLVAVLFLCTLIDIVYETHIHKILLLYSLTYKYIIHIFYTTFQYNMSNHNYYYYYYHSFIIWFKKIFN